MDKLRFVGISSSPRHGNTEIMVKEALEAAKQEALSRGYEAETVFISFKGKKIQPCLNCDACVRQKRYCVLKDDWLDMVKNLIDPMPNGLILGSPVYFFNVNSAMRAFMERCTSLVKGVWDPEFPHPVPDWSRTAAGALTIGYDRNGGQETSLTTMLQFLLLNGFVTVSGEAHRSGYIGASGWQMGNDGAKVDAVLEDKEGLGFCRSLGSRVAKTGILLSGRSL